MQIKHKTEIQISVKAIPDTRKITRKWTETKAILGAKCKLKLRNCQALETDEKQSFEKIHKLTEMTEERADAGAGTDSSTQVKTML